jgi:ATP-binding cassette, subfamily B, multidrug efflux pump
MRDLRRLLGFVKPYWRLSVLALVMLCALVVMDLAIPRLIQRIIDQGIAGHDRGVVVRTALQMLAISALSTVIAVANNVFSVRVGEGVARDLREALFLKIQGYSFGNLDRQKTGQLLVRLTSDVGAVKALTQISLRIGTRAPLLMIGSLVLMITTGRRLALMMLPLLLVTSLLIAFFVVRMEPLFRLVQQKLDAVNNVLQENIAGARLVKGLVRADHEGKRFEVANEEMTLRSIKVMQLMALMQPALTMCINIGVVIVIWLGGTQSIRGELSVGQIVAFTNYLFTTMTPLIMMTMLSNTWASGLASLRRMDEILGSVPDVVDAEGAAALPASAPATVSFDDVSFTYAGVGGDAVLRGINLAATPGKTIAILGSTGAGKSTLVNLIPRFYDVSSGRLLVGGRDVRAVTQASLIAHVGVVPQESVLFSGTVRDNIRYGRPDAGEADVVRAAQAAQAHEFISKMPQGYDSRIEQRGANLSGGQKQRIAIARALLVDPKILILDDSTSAVDVETETRIQIALAENKSERTTFVVAQRISTVLDADLIVVLDKGSIVAEGTHRELMTTSPVYREIYDSQLGKGLAEEAEREPAVDGAPS